MQQLKSLFADPDLYKQCEILALEDGAKIFHPEADQFEIAYHLQELTRRTERRYQVHDFIKPGVGKGIVHDFPVKGETVGLSEIHLFSLRTLVDGDMIWTRGAGEKNVLRMLFDAEADPRTSNLYKVYATPFLPHLDIGHKMR